MKGSEDKLLTLLFDNYANLRELPADAPVKKGDILKATKLVTDPTFGGSEIIILSYGLDGFIWGTSLQIGHPCYMYNGTWSSEGLKREMLHGLWEKSSPLEGSLRDYYTRLNQSQQ